MQSLALHREGEWKRDSLRVSIGLPSLSVHMQLYIRNQKTLTIFLKPTRLTFYVSIEVRIHVGGKTCITHI